MRMRAPSNWFIRVGKSILREIQDIVEGLICNYPGRTGFFLRRIYYKCRMRHVGRNVVFGPGCRIKGCRYISIDDHSVLALGCTLIAGPIDTHAGPAEYRERHNGEFTQDQIGRAHV